MSTEKNKDSYKENKLSLFFNYPSEVQKDIRNTSENKAGQYKFSKVAAISGHSPDNNKAQGSKSLQNNCCNILLFVFLNDEKAGQYEA
jgi:hypothetical protein